MRAHVAALLLVTGGLLSCQSERGAGVTPGGGDGAGRDGLSRSATAPQGTTLGLFAVNVDLHTLAARVEPLHIRGGQQSELYNLEINDFLTWESFRVTGVSLTDESLLLTYVLTHPFRTASNLAGPSTAANREDLAITGRVVWLVDDPDAETYFAGDGDVRVNTRMVQNADGYWSPGSLIGSTGGTANTFPYQLMVDEARDNRVGLTNGGSAYGNYGPLGWQVAEFTEGIGGFDVLAQGQAASNTLMIARSEIGGGSTFDVVAALIAKYEDPRGGVDGDERRTNRLPEGNVLEFTYRMPHGALDVSRIEVVPPQALVEGEFGSVYSAAHVRDWDARAAEALQTNLAVETDPSLVSAGEAGVPTVEIDIPLMNGFAGPDLAIMDDDSGAGGDAGIDAGAALDELYFVGTSTGTPVGTGSITGLVRATDIVDITPPADWLANRIDLGPGLTPLGTGHEGATYQAFTIELLPSTAGAFAWANTVGGTGTDYASAVAVDGVGNSYIAGSFDTTTDFDPGPGTQERSTSAGLDVFVVSYDPNGAFRSVDVLEGDLAGYASGIAVDGMSNMYITGGFLGTCDFETGAGTEERTSTGERDAYVVSLTSGGDFRWVSTFGSTNVDEGLGIVVDAVGNSYTTGAFFDTVDFNAGPGTANRTSNGLKDGFLLALSPTGTYRWAGVMGGSGFDYASGIDQDGDGHLYVAGTFEGSADLNPVAGVETHDALGSYDSFLTTVTSNGNFRWASDWGGNPSDEAYDVTVSRGGFSYICGYFGGACDFDPGADQVTRVGLGFSDGYVLALQPWGSFRWVATINGAGHELPYEVELDDYARLYVAGDFSGTADFCSGPVNVERTSEGYFDGFVLSLGSYGAYRWVGTYGSVNDDEDAASIAVSPLGRSYTVGYYNDTVDFDPGAGVANRTSTGLKDFYLLVLEP